MKTPWFKHTILYSLNVETFLDSNADGIGDFRGLIQSLDYLSYLGIECIWLLPFYPSPLKDDGYDIMDYYSVDPRYGTMEDFEELVGKAAKLNIKIVIDLVVNHTSDQHEWFRKSREERNSKYHDYYIWTKKKPENEKWDVGFAGEQKDVWTYDEAAGEFYLHRFYKEEPDLNTANPDVKEEIKKIVEFWISKGISGFRIDVAQILIELEQPTAKKTRDYTILNLIHDAAFEKGEVMLLAEANDIASRLHKYFGNGDRVNVLFNFFLVQNTFLSLAREEAVEIENGIKKLPLQPENGQWLNFIRNHDDLSLDKLTPDERQEVFDAFAPDENMRIFGKGIRRRLAPMLKNNRRQMELIYSLIFSFPGIPMLRYGDEIGMGEDLSLKGRRSVRTVMQWNNEKNGGFSDASSDDLIMPSITSGEFSYHEVNVLKQKRDENSFLNFIRKLISLRKKYREIGDGVFSVINTGNPEVLVHKISGEKRTFIAIHNLSGNDVRLNINMTLIEGRAILKDNEENGTFTELAPYGYRWLLMPNKEKNEKHAGPSAIVKKKRNRIIK